jgi:hypothetical protein
LEAIDVQRMITGSESQNTTTTGVRRAQKKKKFKKQTIATQKEA